MPKIRQYTQQTTAQGGISTRRATGADFGPDFGEIGQAIDQVAKQMEEEERYKQGLQADRQLAEDRVKWAGRMDELRNSLPHGGVGMDVAIDKEMGEYAEQASEVFTDPKIRDKYKTEFLKMKAGFQITANAEHAAASGAQEKFVFGEIFEKNLNAVTADPSVVLNTIEQERRLIDESPRLSEKDKLTTFDGRQETLWNAAVTGYVTKAQTPEEVTALLGSLKKESWQHRLNPTDYQRAIYALETKKERLTAQRSTEFIDGLNEHIREVSAGVLSNRYTEADIRANITDPNKQRQAIDKLNQARQVGQIYSDVKSSSHAERVAMVNDLNAKLQTPGDYDVDSAKIQAAVRAMELQKKQYEADPVSYTAEVNIEVANARQTYEENPSPEALDHFVTTTVTEQLRQGTDPRDVVILNSRDVAQLEQRLRDVDKVEDPQQALVKIQEIKDEYGKHWPTVSKQLQKEKALTGTQAIAAGMPVRSVAAATQLMIADGMSKKDFEAVIPDFNETQKGVKDSVRSQLSDFYGTLIDSVNGPEQITGYGSAVEKLALYRMSRGDSQDEAEAYAVKHLVTDRWTVQNGIRIPKSVPEPPGAIVDGSRRYLATMDLSDVVPYQSLLGVDPESRKTMTIDSIRESGRWITNSDESGLVLVDTDGYEVLRENGMPYYLDWSDAADGAISTDNAGRTFPGVMP